jgi:hypothetical protein
MKFYNREKELANLSRIRELSLAEGQMTVLVGLADASAILNLLICLRRCIVCK